MGVDPISLVSQGLGAIEGGYQFFDNLAKEKHDRKELQNLQTPFYKIQDEYNQNRNLAGGLAEGGMPSATKDYITGESQRGLGAAISGATQSGGNPNDFSKIFSAYNKNIDATGAQDAENHTKNIQYFIDANKDLAAQKTIQFGVNKMQPYQRKLAQLTQNISNEQVNANNGANTAIGSIGAMGTSSQNDGLLSQFKTQNSLLDKLFGGSSPNPVKTLAVDNTNQAPTYNRNQGQLTA
jgi:hypothetical protein